MSFLTRWLTPPPPFEPPEERSAYSIADPQLALLFGGEPSLSGVSVTENTAMGLSAVYRSVSLISGTIATLPLRTVATSADGTTQRVPGWLDDPCGPNGPTPHEFIEGMMTSLLLEGNFFAIKVYGGAGQLLMLQPISSYVGIEVRKGRKFYRVQLEGGKTVELTDQEVLHIPGLSLDGVRGVSPIAIARNSFGTSIAGERAAARLFKNGLLSTGIVTATEKITPEEAELVRETLERTVVGEANAGGVPVFNKGFTVNKLQIDPVDAQFLESRRHQVSEIARWFGVPPHLIGDVERSTSWGTGIAEQTLGFQRFTIQAWTSRIEARLSRLLEGNRKVEFDFRQLVAGTPAQEIELLLKQVEAGTLTANEMRAMLNRPPLPEPTREPEAEE